MNKKDIFNIWAPYNNKWTGWVRPVPFITLDKEFEVHTFYNYELPIIGYVKDHLKDTAFIIDEEGIDSIKEGIALAHLGYRPIPTFNGTNPNQGTRSVTDNESLEVMLIWGALELTKIKLDDNASPVFLADRNRLNRFKEDRSIFDNSYDVYSQDLPTHEYFLKNGINKIIIKGPKLNKDLTKILYKHQANGMSIYYTNGFDEPVLVKLKKVKEEL